ncbi:hypothetical protein [Streptomyces sp. NPDC088400]|uniref:hypothetical protein n=1 Tax=Streptomyces sp. NPDC088400 TaxID=3365861 RepID=UPI0037F8358B
MDVEELCRALGKRRGRPIDLRPVALEKPGPSGVWVDFPQMDVIFYQQETTRLHQDHIILHEVGHLIVAKDEEVAQREKTPDDFAEGWKNLIPVVDRGLIRRFARRCSYESGEECAVELVATILLEWSSVFEREAPLPADPSLRRIQSALEGRRGWI